jgi:radical SAM protein with 4Fe4S-binding SPASM domain
VEKLIWDPWQSRTYLVRAGRIRQVMPGEVGMTTSKLRTGDTEALHTPFPAAATRIQKFGWHRDQTIFRVVPRPPHLKRVQIEVGLRCNLHCAYCYSTSGPSQRRRIESDDILRLIHQADDLGVLALDFTGGEFLLDPSWANYLALANELGFSYTVHTNGTLFTPRRLKTLARYAPTAVLVSLDSHLADIHDRARGRSGALARTLAGLDLLQQHTDLPVRITLMAHSDNLSTLDDTIGFLRDRFPSAQLNIDRVIPVGGAVESGQSITAEQFWKVLSPRLARAQGTEVTTGRICKTTVSEDFEPDCGMAYSFVYVTADGEVASCPTMTGREEARFRGPLISDGLGEAWYDSDLFRRTRFLNCENVLKCPAGAACGGGCRSNAYAETGRLAAPDVIACNVHKNNREDREFIDFPLNYSSGAPPQV